MGKRGKVREKRYVEIEKREKVESGRELHS